jgi:hypothetical protein
MTGNYSTDEGPRPVDRVCALCEDGIRFTWNFLTLQEASQSFTGFVKLRF